jgi:hypothetical protein
MQAMSRALCLLCSLTVVALSGAAAQNDSFARDMFSPSVISLSGIEGKRLAALTARQREDLLSCRNALSRFFLETQSPTPQLNTLVDPRLLRKYPSQAAFLRMLLSPETSVVLVGVTDFEIRSANEILLDYYLVVFAEGELLTNSDRVVLKRGASSWLITEIGGL